MSDGMLTHHFTLVKGRFVNVTPHSTWCERTLRGEPSSMVSLESLEQLIYEIDTPEPTTPPRGHHVFTSEAPSPTQVAARMASDERVRRQEDEKRVAHAQAFADTFDALLCGAARDGFSVLIVGVGGVDVSPVFASHVLYRNETVSPLFATLCDAYANDAMPLVHMQCGHVAPCMHEDFPQAFANFQVYARTFNYPCTVIVDSPHHGLHAATVT